MRPFDGYFILLMMWNGIPIVQYWRLDSVIPLCCSTNLFLLFHPFYLVEYSDKEENEELTGK